MTRPLLIIFLLTFSLASCGLGAKKVKNIIELTPKLSVDTNELIRITPDMDKGNIFSPEIFKNKEYTITKHKIIAEPVFDKAIVYIIDAKGNVVAFSKKNKTIIWSTNVSNNLNDTYVGGGILYHNDKLYITNGSRYLVVLNSKSGHEIIRKELPDIIKITPVLINPTIILVQTVSNQILALNIQDLNFVWQHEGMIETLTSSYHATPIVQNGRIIINYSTGQIFALDANNGEALWSHDLASNQDSVSSPNFEATSLLCKPVIDNSNIYFANSAGWLIKINIMTGNILWQTKAEDIQSMSLSGNSLFITNNAGQVAAINTNSGKIMFASYLNHQQEGKAKTATFLAPIIAKTANNWTLNIISNRGELYSFSSNSQGILSDQARITKVSKDIQYYGKTCCGSTYFTTNRKIIFGETQK
jgi:outer membrane protein assembly factor BamB